MNREEFIKRAKEIHGDKYDYSKVEYINSQTKVCIICPEHGEFWQRANEHLQGRGCLKCCHDKRKSNVNNFIKQAKEVHGDKYDYSKVEYKTALTKVCIICPEHGEFWQTPHSHLKGCGCLKCCREIQNEKKKITQLGWIERAKEIHGDKYDYSKVEYIDSRIKVCIICPKHGEFWQVANRHLRGGGCPKCKNSTLENKVLLLLEKNNIKYVYQYFPKFLNNGIGHQSLDFYLPDYNIAIECQGEQHYKPVNAFGGYEQFLKQIELDKKKFDICNKNGINILYFSQYKGRDKNAISSLKILLNEITKNIK